MPYIPIIEDTDSECLHDYTYHTICYPVNCKGVMNTGLTKAIKEKYPIVFETYHKYCMSNNNLLGSILPVFTGDDRLFINMFIVNNRDGKNYIDCDLLEKCLDKIFDYIKSLANKVRYVNDYGKYVNFPLFPRNSISCKEDKLFDSFEKKLWDIGLDLQEVRGPYYF